MTVWEKPSYEELAMNAEIGAYQPDGGEDRDDVPFARAAPEDATPLAVPVHCG